MALNRGNKMTIEKVVNAETYVIRKIQTFDPYSRYIGLPAEHCKENHINKGTEMLVIGKWRVFVILPINDYIVSSYLRQKIEKLFEEEKI